MARGGGLCRGEVGGVEVMRSVGREDLARSCGAPSVLDSQSKLVHENVVREVSLYCRGARVRGEVQEEHPASMHVFNSRHVVAGLGEEGKGGLLVSFESGRDCIV